MIGSDWLTNEVDWFGWRKSGLMMTNFDPKKQFGIFHPLGPKTTTDGLTHDSEINRTEFCHRTDLCQFFIVKYLYWPYRLDWVSKLRAVGSEDKSGQFSPTSDDNRNNKSTWNKPTKSATKSTATIDPKINWRITIFWEIFFAQTSEILGGILNW